MSILISAHSIEFNKITAKLGFWLNYDKPLTDKLKELSGDAKINVLFQAWLCSSWWDKYVLNLREDIFQREILMQSNGEVCWYARTIIPASVYRVKPDFFDRLKNESLRHLIFDQPKVKLIKRISYFIDEQAIEFHWMKKYLSTLQGEYGVRLAEFSFENQNSFYLMEILFPKLQEFE